MEKARKLSRMNNRPEGRIEGAFRRLKEKGEKALITFITAGDPDIETTKRIISRLQDSGADIIELGMPFSDPMADGPTIQASSERALNKGTRIPDVLELVKDVRQKTGIPIVLFGYYNPVLSYGLKRFAKDANAAGADGVLIVDLPPEESDELKSALDGVGIDLIFLLTPTSTDDRIRLVASRATGFIYFVSLTGVTGARSGISAKMHSQVKRVKRQTDLPVGVGFGISTPEQAAEVCLHADGAVVGSAIINVIARAKDGVNVVEEAGAFVASLKAGLKGVKAI